MPDDRESRTYSIAGDGPRITLLFRMGLGSLDLRSR